MCMMISDELLKDIESDLGLNVLFEKGKEIPVKNCWHFCTNGNDVDVMFYEEDDFRDGMNRIFIISRKYKIVILAYVLMDTHIHFVLYGDFDECNRFIHEFVNRTSQYIAFKHKDSRKLSNVSISHQKVESLDYLKTVICYTIKNPVAAGMPYLYQHYPWSSGSLYFCPDENWTAPYWKKKITGDCTIPHGISKRFVQDYFKTRTTIPEDTKMIDGIIFPGDYVAYKLVERIFKTCKGFNYFISKNKEDEVDSKGGSIAHLSIPIQELRQHKSEMCMKMFGVHTVKTLSSLQRLQLARALKSQFNSSTKQIARVCGLVYDEVKGIG